MDDGSSVQLRSPRRSFRPADRIRKRPEYQAVQSRGRRVHTPHFLIVILAGPHLPGSTGQPRLGITVTKKISRKAVERNRVKRLVREVFRTHRSLFPRADCVVIAKRGAPELGYRQVAEEFRRASSAMRRAAAGQSTSSAKGSPR